MSSNVHNTQAPQSGEQPQQNSTYKSWFGDFPPYGFVLLGALSLFGGGSGAVVAEKVAPAKKDAVAVEVLLEMQKLRSELDHIKQLQIEAKQERLQQIADVKKEMASKENVAGVQSQVSEVKEDVRKLLNYERQRPLP